MKRLCIIILLLLIPSISNAKQVYSGGGIGRSNHQYSLEQDQIEQGRVKLWFQKTEKFLSDAGPLIDTYQSRVESIIEDGSTCEVSRQKYLRFKDEYGIHNRKTRLWKKAMKSCNDTQEVRLNALKNIEHKYLQLKEIVNEIDFTRKMMMDQEKQRSYRLSELKKDQALAEKIRQLNY